jgi:hypothetical protein
MLSSVLRSTRAMQVNIGIMRAFVKLREAMQSNEELKQKLAMIERRLGVHDSHFKVVFEILKKILTP